MNAVLETDLAARLETLFRRCPALHGFSVQQGARVTRDRVAQHLKDDLFLADVACHQPVGGDQAVELVEEIAQALLELVEEQPQASEVLRGRTFARRLH